MDWEMVGMLGAPVVFVAVFLGLMWMSSRRRTAALDREIAAYRARKYPVLTRPKD